MYNFYLIVPPPTIKPIPDINVTTGLNATFTCKATGFGLKYSWEVPSSLINNNGIVIGDNTNELTVVNVTKHVNGIYTCNVTDFIGQTDIAMAELIAVGEFIDYCTLYINMKSVNMCKYINMGLYEVY